MWATDQMVPRSGPDPFNMAMTFGLKPHDTLRSGAFTIFTSSKPKRVRSSMRYSAFSSSPSPSFSGANAFIRTTFINVSYICLS